jgi:hypothetical protein
MSWVKSAQPSPVEKRSSDSTASQNDWKLWWRRAVELVLYG